ncbi:MAG: four helix bundle protein [Candidatus Saccharimonadales bacterium]
MSESNKSPNYDLEERTYQFAKKCRLYIKGLKPSITNIEDAKQLTRSSGSIAANYIEANEALSRKDFVMRVKISRKEAKETMLWLRLLDAPDELQQEALELKKIMSAIIDKAKQ